MRSLVFVLVGTILLAFRAPAYSINRCVGENGKMVFTDRECAPDKALSGGTGDRTPDRARQTDVRPVNYSEADAVARDFLETLITQNNELFKSRFLPTPEQMLRLDRLVGIDRKVNLKEYALFVRNIEDRWRRTLEMGRNMGIDWDAARFSSHSGTNSTVSYMPQIVFVEHGQEYIVGAVFRAIDDKWVVWGIGEIKEHHPDQPATEATLKSFRQELERELSKSSRTQPQRLSDATTLDKIKLENDSLIFLHTTDFDKLLRIPMMKQLGIRTARDYEHYLNENVRTYTCQRSFEASVIKNGITVVKKYFDPSGTLRATVTADKGRCGF